MGARTTVLALAALGVLALHFPPAPARAATTIGFWAGESVPGTDRSKPGTYWNPRSTRAYTPRLWEALRRNHMQLYFNLRFRRDFGPLPKGRRRRHDALRIVRTANRLGVPVWGWVLIPYSAGYWAWEGAATEQMRAVQTLARWKAKNRIRLRGIVIDPEPPVGTPYSAAAALLRGGGSALASVLQRNIDPMGQCAAWNGYSDIVAWARSHHIRIAAAPSPVALDDLGDGRLALQDASQFVVPAAGWNTLFFQAYRSVFYFFRRHDPGPGIVTSYLRSARAHYGSAGEITLGSAGRTGYRRLGDLVHDVRLAATLGAHELPIYSLERTVRAYRGPGALDRLAWAARHPFKSRPRALAADAKRAVASVHTALARADSYAAGATSAPANPWPSACGP